MAVGVLVGLGCAIPMTRWLNRRPYAYPGDSDTARYPTTWVWIALAVVVGLIAAGWWAASPTLTVVLVGYCGALIVLAAIDFDVHRLPNVITVPLIPLTAVGVVVAALVDGDVAHLGRAALGALALFGFYLLQTIVSRGRGMGLGDVKLAVSLGMILAYLSWTHLIVSTLVTYLSAAMLGLYLIIFRGGNRRTEVAFGPHMVIGTVVVLCAPGVVALIG